MYSIKYLIKIKGRIIGDKVKTIKYLIKTWNISPSFKRSKNTIK